MPGLFSRLKSKDGPAKVSKSKKGASQAVANLPPPKPRWEDAWARTTVDAEEVQELLRGCTLELKSRALDMPFLLLPFRPTSDPSAARNFIRNFFDRNLHGGALSQELRLTEPMVLCSVVKWCWSRLPGGVVSWDAYELFKVGESDSSMARDSFATFIPLSVDSNARTSIIFDFFDLLSAIAAHGKSNGLGGRKLSRLAGWWAFEHVREDKSFDGGYKSWAAAADAASHLFFAYLRSLAPGSVKGMNGISTLPMSLQKLVQETEYPPESPILLHSRTTKVAMIVDSVSPTPFALLRRANNFAYRDDDRVLQEFSEYDDPIKALTDECRRVLKSISSANQSQVSSSKESTGLPDASWSRFEDIGFSGAFDENDENDDDDAIVKRKARGLRSTPQSQSQNKTMDMGRPTTPSWADFLSSGFVDEARNEPPPLLLPPDKILPPIDVSNRGKSSQSHRPRLESNRDLEPGELASIIAFDLDDTFWWVWITSLAGEEPPERKGAFGRCALVETIIPHGKWLVLEEIIKGAAPNPDPSAYIAEKKSFWSRSKKGRGMTRSKSTMKHLDASNSGFSQQQSPSVGVSKTSVGPDQHARIQAAAIQLQQREREQELQGQNGSLRGRNEKGHNKQKTNSVFTLQPVIVKEASPAMKWASKYDKDAIKEAYLADSSAGRGNGEKATHTNGFAKSQGTLTPVQQSLPKERSLPASPTSTEPPAVPSKAAAPPPPAPKPEVHVVIPNKAVEAGTPLGSHLIERKPAPSTSIELQPQLTRTSIEQGGSSPENKRHLKLKKKEVGTGSGGFRKMFGRKRDDAKESESLSEPTNGNTPQTGTSLTRRFSGLRKKGPPRTPGDGTPTLSSQAISEDDVTPVATPNSEQGRPYDPSVNSLSRVDSTEAREARHEFSRFDQGPLENVPAFVPQDSPTTSDNTIPSPITPSPIAKEPAAVPESPATEDPLPVVSDRWAQIRKAAADRAAKEGEDQSHTTRSLKTDGDDGETSGEETIESRVARIKARVAELTGNMEGPGAPK